MGEKLIPKFWGEVKDGKFNFNNEIRFFQYLRTIEGEAWLSVGKKRNTRSDSQNRYYWAYLGIISDENGDDPDYLHEVFKRRFIKPEFVTVLGKEYKLPGSTTKLSKQEFGEYITRIEAETGIPAPNPEEYFYQ